MIESAIKMHYIIPPSVIAGEGSKALFITIPEHWDKAFKKRFPEATIAQPINWDYPFPPRWKLPTHYLQFFKQWAAGRPISDGL